MKKNLFLLGLAVAAMTSCTNDEVVEVNQSTQKAIEFESFVNKTTRAITETTAPGQNVLTGLQKFYVYGYYNGDTQAITEFDGWTVTRKEVTENQVTSLLWEYTVPSGKTQPYWTNNNYYFAAVAQGNNEEKVENVTFGPVTVTADDGTETTTEGVLKIENFTVAYQNNQTVTVCNANDLVADIVDVQGSTGKTERVGFNFDHLLSKIQFKITNTSEDGSTVDITAVKINGLKYKGTFTADRDNTGADFSDALKYTNWSSTADIYTDFIAYQATEGVAPDATLTSGEFLVLPQDLASLTVTLTATYRDSNGSIVDKQDLTLNLSQTNYTSWEPQNAYLYQIGLPSSAKPIKFDVIGVDGWTSANNGNAITLN